MEAWYKIYDSKEEGLYVGVGNHYFLLPDAKQAYRNSKKADCKDDSILIEVAKEGSSGVEIEAVVTFGVDEAEKFALTILNLCQLIKN